jgi:hypothetical protein
MKEIIAYFFKLAVLVAVVLLAFKISSCQGPSLEHHSPNPASEIVFPSVPHQPTGNFHN